MMLSMTLGALCTRKRALVAFSARHPSWFAFELSEQKPVIAVLQSLFGLEQMLEPLQWERGPFRGQQPALPFCKKFFVAWNLSSHRVLVAWVYCLEDAPRSF